MIELIDEQVGRMLATLEDTGQRDNTIVLFISDHGEMLGDHGLWMKGCRFYEGLARVPLIVSWPGHLQAGLQADALVELTDIVPTLAEAAGISLPWTHGRSLLPIMTGQVDPRQHREFVRAEYDDTIDMDAPRNRAQHIPCWATMYRDARYKLITYHGLEYGELFDLTKDPDEFDNRWDDPAYAVLRAQLLQQSFDATVQATDPGPDIIGRY